MSAALQSRAMKLTLAQLRSLSTMPPARSQLHEAITFHRTQHTKESMTAELTMPSNWSIGDAPNGGLLLGMALNAGSAMLSESQDGLVPLSASMHYSAKCIPDELARIQVWLNMHDIVCSGFCPGESGSVTDTSID